MIAAGMVTEAEIRDFTKTQIVARDEVWTEAAIHILKKYKPNLLLFHLLATDSNQHRYGAQRASAATPRSALADARVKRIVDTAAGPRQHLHRVRSRLQDLRQSDPCECLAGRQRLAKTYGLFRKAVARWST